jgi:hypothetical protein
MPGPFDDLPETKATSPFDDLPDVKGLFDDLPEAASTLQKVLGSVPKAAYALNQGLVGAGAGVGTAWSRLSDIGPRPHSYRQHVREMELAGELQTTPERAASILDAQRDIFRGRLTAPGLAYSDAASEVADEFGQMRKQQPGYEAPAKVAELTGGTLPFVAEAAIPVVGPAVAAAHGGLETGGEVWRQAFAFYRKQGLNEEEATKQADAVASRAGAGSAIVFSALPGAGGKLAEVAMGERLINRPVARALAETTLSGGQAGAVMTADKAQQLAQAQQTYRPDLTAGEAASDLGKTFLAGAATGAAMHAPAAAARAQAAKSAAAAGTTPTTGSPVTGPAPTSRVNVDAEIARQMQPVPGPPVFRPTPDLDQARQEITQAQPPELDQATAADIQAAIQKQQVARTAAPEVNAEAQSPQRGAEAATQPRPAGTAPAGEPAQPTSTEQAGAINLPDDLPTLQRLKSEVETRLDEVRDADLARVRGTAFEGQTPYGSGAQTRELLTQINTKIAETTKTENANEPSSTRQPGGVPGQHQRGTPSGQNTQGGAGPGRGNEPARPGPESQPEAQAPKPGVNETGGGDAAAPDLNAEAQRQQRGPEPFDPATMRKLREQGVTEENIRALAEGEKTPSTVVGEQLAPYEDASYDEQIAAIGGSQPTGTQTHPQALEQARFEAEAALHQILEQATLTKPAGPGRVEPSAAPETNTVRTGTGAESSAPRGNDAQTGAEMTAETDNTVRSAADISSLLKDLASKHQKLNARLEAISKGNPGRAALRAEAEQLRSQMRALRIERNAAIEREAAAKKTGAPAKALKRPEAERAWDIIDEYEASVGGKISLQKARELIENFQPIGAARKHFTNRGGMSPDLAAQGVGNFKRLSDEDFLRAFNAAAEQRISGRQKQSREQRALETEAGQIEGFERDANRYDPAKEGVIPATLREGDEFTLRGAKFEVSGIERDGQGNVTAVRLKDGAKYGTQTRPAERKIFVDRGSVRLGPEHDGRDTLHEERPLFGKPETVAEQKARLKLESQRKTEAAQLEEVRRRAAAPLEGSRGDIGQRDMFGGGDLFSLKESAQRYFGKPYDQLSPAQREHLAMINRRQRAAKEGGLDSAPLRKQTSPREEQAQNAPVQGRQPPGEPAGRGSRPERGERPATQPTAEPAQSSGALQRPATGAPSKPVRFDRPETWRHLSPEQIEAAMPRGEADPDYPAALGAMSDSRLQTEIDRLRQQAAVKYSEEPTTADLVVDPKTGQLKNTLDPQMAAWRRAGQRNLTERTQSELAAAERERARRKNPDRVRAWLDKAIEATDPMRELKQGELLGGLALPKWLAEEVAHGALKAARAAWDTGKTVKEAIEAGLAWLRDQRLKDYNEDQAREWLTQAARDAGVRKKSTMEQWAEEDSQATLEQKAKEARKAVEDIRARGQKAPDELVERAQAAEADANAAGTKNAEWNPPPWMPRKVAELAISRLRDPAINRGSSESEAISQAVEWMRFHYGDLPGFNAVEARAWFEGRYEPPENLPSSNILEGKAEPTSLNALKSRRDQITRRMGEIAETAAKPSGLSAELRSERYHLGKESLDVQRQLESNPEHVRELLKFHQQVSDEFAAAKDAGDVKRVRELRQDLESVNGDLAMVDPELLNRTYQELVDAGQIKKSAPGHFSEGRTLGDMTEWLKSKNIDSPKLTLAERFSLARRMTEEWFKGKTLLQKAGARVQAAWQAFKAQYKAPPKDGDFRSLVKQWFYSKQWTGLETKNWVDEINRQIPRPDRQMGISAWLDAEGNRELLKAQLAEVPARWQPAWRAALELTPSEIELATRVRNDFADKLEVARTSGLVDKGRQHYGVPQIWEILPKTEGDYEPGQKPEAKPRNPTAKLDPRAPFFSLQRTHDSYFDGIMAGGVPKDLRVSKLVGIYNADFHNSLADRSVIAALRKATAADGKPVTVLAGNVRITPGTARPGEPIPRAYFVDSNWRPKDAVAADGRPYRTVDHWALRGWKFASKDAEGNPIIVHGDFLVHPDHYAFLKNELKQSWLRDPEGGGPYFNWLLNSAAFLKSSKFASATFHMATLAEHSMFHAISGKPSAERASLLWPSVSGVKLDPKADPELAKLMVHGTNLGFDGQRELFEEGLSSHGGIWGHVPGLGDAMTKLSDWLFGRYMPALKVKTAKVLLHANLERYAGKLSEEQIYELSANQANAAFGAQQNKLAWSSLGRNKTMLDVNRLLLNAPDFLLSRAKVVGQALKPYNREQRLFLIAQGALVYTAARVLNQLFNGDPEMAPENAFRVIYKGRARSARFIVSDMAHLASDPASFASGRLSPHVRSAIETITGRDMRTGAAKGVWFETNNKALRIAQIFLKDEAEWLTPVGVEGLLPGAPARDQTKAGQLASGLLGVGSQRYTAATRLYDLARDFNRKADSQTHLTAQQAKAAELWQKQRDDEAGKASPYRNLDVYLESGNNKRAAAEYTALLEGRNPRQIAEHFLPRPFTGRQDREAVFREQNKQLYQQAVEERRKRLAAFQTMLAQRRAALGAQIPPGQP